MLAAFAAGCGTAACVARRYPDVEPVLLTNDIWGVTFCMRGEPVVWINATVFGTADEAGTIGHERKHAEQIRRFSSCGAYDTYAETHMAELEAEAFCEDVKADMAPPRSLSFLAAVSKYAGWLSNNYPELRLTRDAAAGLIAGFCV